MKEKVFSAIFAAVCLLMALTLSVGFLINGPSEAGANERLSAAPALKNADGTLNTAYLSDVSRYFSDRFYLRQELISAHNAIVAALFRSSAEDGVILGSGGWLYYEPTLGDYTGTAAMSGRDLASAAGNLALMQEYCESQGASFVFVPAPNKNSIYGENMPSYGVKAAPGTRNAQRLFEELDRRGVNYVDLFSAFSAEEETLYFAHDSHWNSRGAALAADLINAALGIRSGYYSGDFSASRPHSGDLFEMLYPAGTDSETDPVYGGGLSFEHVADGAAGSSVRADSITISTTGAGEGGILAFRDSFGNLLYPYLADSSANALFSRAVSYDLGKISAVGADRVLVQLVERNLDYLVTYYPLMPAPEREISAGESLGSLRAFAVNENANAPEGTVLAAGTLGAEPDEDSPIYILCGDRAYEAFCLAGGSFAAYIPDTAQPAGAAFYLGGELMRCG